jgi:hypothetical protein
MFDAWKLKKRMDSMEDTLQKLLGGFQSLELEWVNAYAKFKKIAGRIAKDQSVIDSRDHNSQETPGDGLVDSAGSGGLLTPRQKALQQQILRRRGGLQ